MKGRHGMSYVLVGAAVGAVLGALGGWMYERSADESRAPRPLTMGKLIGVGGAILQVLRQLKDEA